MCFTMSIITRAARLVRLSSEANFSESSGAPSRPTWQYVQRTPSPRAKVRIVAISSCFPIVLGRTFRLVNESGGNFPCAGSAAAKAADTTTRAMDWRIDPTPRFLELPDNVLADQRTSEARGLS